MAEPRVVRTLREFQDGILTQEAAQFEQMARQWRQVEIALQADLDAVIAEMNRLREQGKRVSPSLVRRHELHRTLVAKAQEQVEQYVDYADGLIASKQHQLAGAGLSHAATALAASGVSPMVIGEVALPISAVETMVGLAGNGTPLREVLRSRMVRDDAGNPLPGVEGRLVGTLVAAVAKGQNPRETARQMQNDLAGGLTKALTIARTEQIRAYGLAQVRQYRESGVVRGVLRLPAHNSNVCGACLADEGTFYPLTNKVPDHPRGRCASTPWIKGMPRPTWTGGEEWFSTQDEQTQASILGPGRLQAYQEGQFGFSDLVTHKEDSEWGPSVVPTPLHSLTEGRDAQ